MTDTVKLREKIDQSGYRIKFIAEKIGITYQGLLNKINNKTQFNAGEIKELCNLLGIDTAEKESIFFAE